MRCNSINKDSTDITILLRHHKPVKRKTWRKSLYHSPSVVSLKYGTNWLGKLWCQSASTKRVRKRPVFSTTSGGRGAMFTTRQEKTGKNLLIICNCTFENPEKSSTEKKISNTETMWVMAGRFSSEDSMVRIFNLADRGLGQKTCVLYIHVHIRIMIYIQYRYH